MIPALAYLAALVFFGDALCRRWFSYVSWSHRLATAVLVGLLAGSWASYLCGWALDGVGLSLGWANLAVAVVLVLVGLALRRRPGAGANARLSFRDERWDWLVLGLITLLVGWMMFSTFGYADGRLRMAVGVWSDFGPTTAIAQSFAVGDNFPTEYPHYAGEPIRYHFLYYFQVGNLTHLGLDPALANNVLSVATMVAMLALVIALGRRVFGSAIVGRIGAGLFFVHGSLSFIPLLASYGSLDVALAELPRMTAFVDSGFPYRGEQWGIWSQMVFLNQRHLASGIGLLLVIVLFLVQRLAHARRDDADPADAAGTEVATGDERPPAPAGAAQALGFATLPRLMPARSILEEVPAAARRLVTDRALPGYVLCGLVAGLLPLWNGAMFIASGAVLAVWLAIFPNRAQMVVLGIVAAVAAVPQLLFVRAGAAAGGQSYPAFYWGYIIEDPTLEKIAAYVAFIFGPKLLLIAVALYLGTSLQRRFFVAFTSLVAVAFTLQLGVEVLANHKFINVWLVVANLFVAAGLIGLWRTRSALLIPPRVVALRIPARLVALALAGVIVTGGVIEFMPVKNQATLEFPMEGDRLFGWLRTETDEKAVFLSNLHVVHPITLAGRRLWLGWTYYAWSAGYAVPDREREYRELFALRDPGELVLRLQAHGITHVAFDDGLRTADFPPDLNEDIYQANFEPVFVDSENRYGNLVIYAVPSDPPAADGRPATRAPA